MERLRGGRGTYLSLDDVEQEVWVAAAAQQVAQAQRLVQSLHLLQDEGWGPARGTPGERHRWVETLDTKLGLEGSTQDKPPHIYS